MIHHIKNELGNYWVVEIEGNTFVLTGTPGTQTFIVAATLPALKTYKTAALQDVLRSSATLHKEGYTNANKLRLCILQMKEKNRITIQQAKDLNEFSHRCDSRPALVRRRMRAFGLNEDVIRDMDFTEPDSQFESTLIAMTAFIKGRV